MNLLNAQFFDGLSAKAQAAQLSVRGDQLVVELGGQSALRVALKAVQWPERTRYGSRIAQLPDGASVQSMDVEQWDAWVAQEVSADSLLVRAQQSWRGVAVASLLLVAALVGMYLWGLPVAARGVLAVVPHSVDRLLGEQLLSTLEGDELHPSALPLADQSRIRNAFAQTVQRAYPQGAPEWRLEFRSSQRPGKTKSSQPDVADQADAKDPPARSLGANAFALPGGTLVVTDELVNLVKDDQVVLGVLSHEIGHVKHRHGMRQLVQITALSAIASAAFGDYASLLATLPVLAAGMAYSRDAEREADDEAIKVLAKSGISPLVMVKLFKALRDDAALAADTPRNGQQSKDGLLGIAFSSHPSDNQRIARFEEAAKRGQ